MKIVYTTLLLWASLLIQLLAQVPNDPNLVRPALIGSSIPDVEMKKLDGSGIALSDVVKGKKTILVFYRGGWCPYCNKQLAGLAKASPQLQKMGYEIVGISPDSPEFLNDLREGQSVPYTLLSDDDMEASKTMGLAYKLDDVTVTKYKSMGLDLEARSGHKHHLLPVPAVYFVNEEGKIVFSYVNPDYKVRIQSDVLLSVAKSSLQS